MFPDEMFADLFTDVARRSVPPMIVAAVMVLQRIEGLSDREAVDRLTSARGFDGFKGHIAIDSEAEIMTAIEVTAANAGDAEPAADLLADGLPEEILTDTGDAGKDGLNLGAAGAAAVWAIDEAISRDVPRQR